MPSFCGALILSDDPLAALLSVPSLLVVPVFQQEVLHAGAERPEKTFVEDNDLIEIEKRSGFAIASLLRDEEYTGSFGSAFYLPSLNPIDGISLLLVGMGRPDRLDASRMHRALREGLSSLKRKRLLRIIVSLECFRRDDLSFDIESATLQAFCAVADITYRSREAREPGHEVERLILRRGAGDVAFLSAVERARSRARDLVNMPANLKSSDSIAAEARSIPGGEVQIEEDIEWIRKNMPCFYEVAKGSLSVDPPKWIKAVYRSRSGPRRRIALVGKAVVFDTGGYQVKGGDFMNTMKADMTGGATVLSILREVESLQLPGLELHAYCPVTSNRIDSHAMTCDSIVESASGKRVEIRHTDAEGRLTLIDAVAQVARESPEMIIVVATLTGSAGRAVGPRIALMSNEARLRDRFAGVCRRAGESVQTLDVLEEDFEDIRSKLDGADINNTGNEKYRGAQTAAAFVMSGLPDRNMPLLHLDIAGGDMTKDEKATGIVVKGLMSFLRDLASES